MEGLLSLYYRKYKTALLPIFIFILSLFVVFKITFPQFSNISATKAAITQQKQEVVILKKTLSTLNILNSSQVDSDLSTATLALPTSKNIVAVFSSLSNVSAKTNTIIKSFSLKVGDLYSKKGSTRVSSPAVQSPFLAVTVSVTAPTSIDLINFSQEVQKSLPLAEVKKITIDGSNGTFEVNFFYKSTNLSAVSLNHDVAPLTPKENQLIDKLSSWAK